MAKRTTPQEIQDIAATSRVQVEVRFTPRGSDLLPRDVTYELSMPSQGGLPQRGDFVTITVGNHQLTFRVVARNFELLSGITTIRIELGALDEALL